MAETLRSGFKFKNTLIAAAVAPVLLTAAHEAKATEMERPSDGYLGWALSCDIVKWPLSECTPDNADIAIQTGEYDGLFACLQGSMVRVVNTPEFQPAKKIFDLEFHPETEIFVSKFPCYRTKRPAHEQAQTPQPPKPVVQISQKRG